MALLDQLHRLIDDPAPSFVFEVSQDGIAHAVRPAKKNQELALGFQPFQGEVLAVSPVKDNVLQPDVFRQQVAMLAPVNGNARRRRDAALILPDYCVRVVVLDFESFPADRNEQLSLVRFRMKKTVPFELESAAVSYDARQVGKKYEVVVAAGQVEVIARYEAPFRAAGFIPGYVTTSMLAAVELMPAQGLHVAAKLSGRVLTVAVCEGRRPKLVRCVELDSLTMEEVMAVLFPTLAYAEDELPQKPQMIYACGFAEATDALRAQCETDLGLGVEPLRSPWGPPNMSNAGLLGWLQGQEPHA
jgi:type IV pilus assembly protein PilM